MKNITDVYVERLYELSKQPLADEIVEQAKMCLVDYLGCVYSGVLPCKEKTDVILRESSVVGGNVPIIGRTERTSLQTAALLNGIHSHAQELDDGNRYAITHAGVAIFSALFPMAMMYKVDGTKFINAIVIGYEAALCLAAAIQPGHKLKGYHATGTCGCIGAAVALGILFDCDKTKLKNIVSAAVTDSAGLLVTMDDASELALYNAGRAAASAVNAYLVGNAGFKGPDDALAGRFGLFQTQADCINESYIVNGFEGKYAIETIYRKPYPACRYCHAPIEAALSIQSKQQLDFREIQEVVVETFGLAVNGHDHREIKGITSAKMSIPYAVATSFAKGSIDITDYKIDAISNADVLHLTSKVAVKESAELTALIPEKRAAIVHAMMKNGQSYVSRVDYPKGEPENPILSNELNEKTISLLRDSGISTEKIDAIVNSAWNVETKLSELLSIISER